jgi:HSP20 family molecular chaperone IbpA
MLSGGGVPHLLDLFSPTSMLSPTWALDLQGAQRDSFVVEETEQEFKLSLQVPAGLHKKNLKVLVDPGAHTLSIKGHATVGGTSVHTSFFLDLPASVVADPAHKATASLASGILQLTFAKCAPTPPSKLHKLDIEEAAEPAKRPHKASSRATTK